LRAKTSKLKGIKQVPNSHQPAAQATHCRKIIVHSTLWPMATELPNVVNFLVWRTV